MTHRYRTPDPQDFPPGSEFAIREHDVPLVHVPGQGWFNWFGGAPQPCDPRDLEPARSRPVGSFDEWRELVERSTYRTIMLTGLPGGGAETTEVRFLGPAIVRIEHQPLFAEGIGFGDVLEVREAEGGCFETLRIIEKGRWRTVNFMVPPDWPGSAAARPFYRRVGMAGGHCEIAMGGVLMVILPEDCPQAVLETLGAMLNRTDRVADDLSLPDVPKPKVRDEGVVVARCSCCSQSVRREAMGFATESGCRDLDTRPAGRLRSTLGNWVLRCPHCGYCARDIGQGGAQARPLVESAEYRALLADPAYPEKANEFNCKAYLDLRTERTAQGFWALVHAAWVCDDAACADGARTFRRAAVRVGRSLLTAGTQVAGLPFHGDPGETEAILADLLRRAGDFDQAVRTADDGLAKRPSPQTAAVLGFQRLRALDADADRHTFDDVGAPGPRAVAPRQAPPGAPGASPLDEALERLRELHLGAQFDLARDEDFIEWAVEQFRSEGPLMEDGEVFELASLDQRFEQELARAWPIFDRIARRLLSDELDGPPAIARIRRLFEREVRRYLAGDSKPVNVIGFARIAHARFGPVPWLEPFLRDDGYYPGAEHVDEDTTEREVPQLKSSCRLFLLYLEHGAARGEDMDAWRRRDWLKSDGPAPPPVADGAGKRVRVSGTAEAGHPVAHDHAVALFKRGCEAFAEGKHERAERALLDAIDAFRALNPNGDWLFTAINELGVVLKKVGRLREAADCYRQAHEHFLTRHGLDHRDTAITMHNLGATLSELGDVEAGAALLERALGLQLEKGHTKPIDLVHNYQTLAGNHRDRGDLVRSFVFYEKALALHEAMPSPDPADIAEGCAHLCELAGLLGDHQARERYARRMIALREAGLGRYHRETADACNELGVALTSLGRFAEAEAAFRDALGRLGESANLGDLFAVTARMNLADLLMKQGRGAEAETVARDALRYAEAGLGPDHPKTGRALETLGDVLRENGRPTEAVPLLTRARRLRREQDGDDSEGYAHAVNRLALALQDCGACEEAAPLFEEALDIFGREFGPGHDDSCTVQVNLARCLLLQGFPEGAEPLLREVLAARKPRPGDRSRNSSIGLAAFRLGEVAEMRGDLGQAAEAYQTAMKMYEGCYGPDSWQVARCCDQLSGIARRGGQRGDAASYAERAHAIRLKLHGIDHPYSLTTFETLVSTVGERNAERALAVARGGYDEARRQPSLSNAAMGVYETVLGRLLIRCGYKEDGAAHLEQGLAARFRDWSGDPMRTLEAAAEFAEACMAVGKYDLIVRALRAILARCEDTAAVADSWHATLRVWIARVLIFTGRAPEAAADARLAWAYYRRPEAGQPWELAAPWVHYWLTADPQARNGLAPWHALLPGDATTGMQVLRIRCRDEDADALAQMLNEFHLLADDGLRLRNVDLEGGPWLFGGPDTAQSCVLAVADALLDAPDNGPLREPTFDPAAPVAAIELSGPRIAVCSEPGAPDAMVRLQTDIVHALMRFQAVRVVEWDSAVPAGGRSAPGPKGLDADDFFEALDRPEAFRPASRESATEPVELNLELAAIYLGIGDLDEARAEAEKALRRGNEEQRAKAEALRRQIEAAARQGPGR